jgi:hypothetical protein
MSANKAVNSQQGRFTWTPRRFALQLALVVPFVHAHLKLFGYNRTLALLRRFVSAYPALMDPPPDIEEFALGMRRIVRRVRDRSPLPGSCLSRSLALWWLLRRQGMDTSLCIGARKFEGRLQAHAWVNLDARPLNAGVRVQEKYVQLNHDVTPPNAE